MRDARSKASIPAARSGSGIGPERALGSVVWQAAEIEAPGVIVHHYGDRMPIGEPSGEKTERVMLLSKLLIERRLQEPGAPATCATRSGSSSGAISASIR